MRKNCSSGSTSGMWKRSTVRIMRHRQTKEPETDRPDLTHRATSRLYHPTLPIGHDPGATVIPTLESFRIVTMSNSVLPILNECPALHEKIGTGSEFFRPQIFTKK